MKLNVKNIRAQTMEGRMQKAREGKWIKDIKFKIPIINTETLLGLDNLNQLETVVLLSQQKPDDHIKLCARN